jgi:hypothetical protein
MATKKHLITMVDAGDRAAYDKVKAFGFEDENITPFTLVSENILQSNTNAYKFQMGTKPNDSNGGLLMPTENRLNNDDVFFGYEYLFAITQRAQTNNQPTEWGVWRTWSNSRIFTGANEALSMKNLYAGLIGMSIGTTRIIDQEKMENMWQVPDFEELEAVSTVAPAGIKQYDSFNIRDLYKPLVPSFYIVGNDTAAFDVQVPQGLTLSGLTAAQGRQNVLICAVKGFRVINAAGTFMKILQNMNA